MRGAIALAIGLAFFAAACVSWRWGAQRALDESIGEELVRTVVALMCVAIGGVACATAVRWFAIG